MKITLYGNDVEEIKKKLTDLSLAFGVTLPEQPQLSLPIDMRTKAAEPTESEAPAQKKRAAKAKAEKTPEPAVEEKTLAPVTKDVARAALEKVGETSGMDTVRELLLKFGADKFSSLKEERFAEFVQACENALA